MSICISLSQISLIIQAFTTPILVIITILYTIFTRKLALISQKQLDLYTRPYPAINKDNSFNFERNKDNNLVVNGINLKFQIDNVGQVPFFYNDTTMLDTIETSSNSTILLQPKQSLFITSHFDFNEIEISKLDIIIKLKIVFWSVDNFSEKKFIERTYKLEKEYFFIISDNQG